jgi:hypothetical protein
MLHRHLRLLPPASSGLYHEALCLFQQTLLTLTQWLDCWRESVRFVLWNFILFWAHSLSTWPLSGILWTLKCAEFHEVFTWPRIEQMISLHTARPFWQYTHLTYLHLSQRHLFKLSKYYLSQWTSFPAKFIHLDSVVYRGGGRFCGFKPPSAPTQNSEVLTKLSWIPSSV